ncbi:MAG TPA: low specificity L-threonine aldolase [Kiloniellales bacterium]|jgi:threonine aldolase
MVSFTSDNASGVAPEILQALVEANSGPAMPYGADAITQRVSARLAEVFETEVTVFPVATGTAANSLSLSVMVPPYGAVYCHELAHIHVDECGAPEFYTGGAKLVPLAGAHGKFDAQTLSAAIEGAGNVHAVQPAAVSITQASEAGTIYSPAEIAALSEVARANGLGLHMDGARFANALVAGNHSPAELTWKSGVDALSFGATKNGALGAEAVVLFKPALADTFAYRRKRGGHLFSKMRFLSAQIEAYLRDDLWLRNARHANAMAGQLASGLGKISGVGLCHPVEANEIFARMPEAMIAGLQAKGFVFYRWGAPAACEVRLVTSFETDPKDVAAFVSAAASLAG